MAKIIWDFGNARWKWFVPANKAKGDYRHAIAPLSDGQWKEIVGRGKPPEGIARVNGVPYAFGDAARNHIIAERPKGAARYTPTYYGVATAFAMADIIRGSDERIALYASHAPQDIRYIDKLLDALDGPWTVECKHGVLNIGFKSVNVFDEPLGGFAHATLTDDGDSKKKNPLANKTTLVIDVGGYTTDIVAVDPGGVIDILSARSSRSGTIKLFSDFDRDLRDNNADLFQSVGGLDPRRVEAALNTGIYQYGKLSIPCHNEAQANVNALVNDTTQIINEAGGPANYDTMLLTGGGGAMIYRTISSAIPTVDFMLAEEVTDNMKFANVFGGAKIAALMKRAKQFI